MPFTLSHAVLAPPIAKLSGQRLPIAALAIGCMTPDLLRLFSSANLTISHEWSGVIIPDLPLGLFFCLLWYVLYRPMLYTWLGLKDELKLNSFNQICGFMLSCIMAVVIGTITHLLWDGLTHEDYRTLAFAGFLGEKVSIWGYRTQMHMLIQVGTSIVTLPLLLWMCLRYFKCYKQPQPSSKMCNLLCWIGFIISVLVGLYWVYGYAAPQPFSAWQASPYDHVGKSINYFFRGFLVSFSLWAMLFVACFGFYKIPTSPD